MSLLIAASYTKEDVSTYFLAIFFLIVMGGISALITAVYRLWAPRKRAQMEALARKHEADAKLSESLAFTTVQQAASAAKTNELLEGQGQQIQGIATTQAVFGGKLDYHGQLLMSIVGQRRGEITPHESTVFFTPGVERSATGTDRPAIVKTEVTPLPPEQAQ